MKEIIRKAKSAKSSKVIGAIVTGSPTDNIHNVPKRLWKKLTTKNKNTRFNNLYAMFWDTFNYHPAMMKDKRFDEYRRTIAHNFALLVVWDEEETERKKCRHSFVKAQGIKGGYVFNYCNKCGITEQIKK